MRALSVVVTVFLVANSGVAADQGKPAQSWLWSDQARIHERFDPEAKQKRIAAQAHATSHTPPGATPINGRTDAALFFPWEIADHLLVELSDPAIADSTRQSYRPNLTELNIDYETFWQAVQAAASDYLAVRKQITEAQRRTRGAEPSGTEFNRLSKELCSARTDFLNSVRSEFGGDQFDKFLYTAVAPRLTLGVTDKRNASELIRVERGCK